jgi:parvulin-like peptidyl-prolyl isomerase
MGLYSRGAVPLTFSSEVLVSKRLVLVMLALVIVTLAGSVAGCGSNLPKDAVAKVGDTYVSQADFDLRVSGVASQYGITKESDPEYYKELEGQVIDIMVENALAGIKATELGFTVTDEEVQAEVDNMLTTWYSGDQAALEQELAAANITMDQLKAEYREYLLTKKVYDEVTKDVPAASAEEISAYYEANKESYYTAESRTVRHILVMPGKTATDDSTTSTTAGGTTTTTTLTDADWAAALAKANEVRAKLVAGGDWTALAAEYSGDPYSKDKGGELGAIGKGEMVEEFENAVFSQAVDEISQPIKTIYGYHVIQVTAITEAVQKTLDDVKDTIATDLADQAKYLVWQSWIADMKTKVTIIYRDDLKPVTTTTAAPASSDTTTAPAGSDTTVAPAESTTTTAGQTITTAAPATTTTT